MARQCDKCDGKWYLFPSTRKHPHTGATETFLVCPSCGHEVNITKERKVRELRSKQ